MFNLYAYSLNNPVMNTDPTGNFVNTIIGALIGGLLGGLVALVNGDNIALGIIHGAAIGAATAAAIELFAGATLVASTFAIGFKGAILSQMILEEKNLSDVNLIHAVWAGVVNSILAIPARYISTALVKTGTSLFGIAIAGTITSGALVGLGITLITYSYQHMPSYTPNDLKEDFNNLKKYFTTIGGIYANF